MDADSLAVLGIALQEVVKGMKGGPNSGSLVLQVADAMVAPSQTEFRARVAQLPVTVAVSRLVGEGHRHQIPRDYYVYDARKLSVLQTIGVERSGEDQGGSGVPQNGSAAPDRLPGGSAGSGDSKSWTRLADPEDEDWCETEFDGQLYFDLCATQEDFDEAFAMMAALEYEVEGYVVKVKI